MSEPTLFTHQIGFSSFLIPNDHAIFNVWHSNTSSKNSLFIPLIAGSLSCAVLFIQAILLLWRKFHQEECHSESPIHIVNKKTYSGYFANVLEFADEHGSFVVFACKVSRFISSAGLLALYLYDLVNQESGFADGVLETGNLPQLSLVFTFWYTSILCALALKPNAWSQTFIQHNNFVLFASFSTYLYRDAWPLATFTEQPLDTIGPLFYAKISLLTLSAVLIPLFVPRTYTPVDPENPMEVPNPEQTASVFSLLTYTFVDSMIMEASRVSHLSHEKLPPMCDYDRLTQLRAKSFPHVDPFSGAKKGRHIFWGLARVFLWELVILTLCLVAMNLSQLLPPIAINRTLAYLEAPHSSFMVRPWFWVLVLLVGPILSSLSFQWYIFINTKNLTRVQAIFTELIFEHSLRIRLKAEASGESTSNPGTGTQTPVEGISASNASTPVDSNSPKPSSAATLTEGSDGGSSDSVKGKSKAELAKKNTPQQAKKKQNLVGKINTLVTVDLDRIVEGRDFLMLFVLVPLELVTSTIFLYTVLGWSAFVGLAIAVVLLPVPGYFAKKMREITAKKMEKTDARVEGITQIIHVLRMVKLFGWEKRMCDKAAMTRQDELYWIFKEKMFYLITSVFNFIIPTASMLITYATFTMIAKEPLTPSKIFSSMTVFSSIRGAIYRMSGYLSAVIRCKVSLDRVDNFLRETELLDNFSEESSSEVNVNFTPVEDNDTIGFNNAIFSWSKDADTGAQTPSSRLYRLKITSRVEFELNALNLIVGPTGSGKTSVLMALLGEMHFMPSSVDSWYNLPRSQGIAYAAQESWVQNETIRDNIVFGAQYDEERYQKVLQQCALIEDLKLFEAGDNTEVGERGLTLSGGQKARITLARAVYSSAQILLLDDILAALDVHTSKHIFRECLQGDLLIGRTVLLVTHNVALTSSVAAKIIAVDRDGLVREVSDISEVIGIDESLAIESKADQEEIETPIPVKGDEKEVDGKLILVEEIEEGHVSWRALKLFLMSLGGDHPIVFLTFWICGLFLQSACFAFSIWYLGYWGEQYQGRDPSDVRTSFYLGQYSVVLWISVLGQVLTQVYYILGSQRASRVISSHLVDSVIRSTFRWLDSTPASRIITRCTQDLGTVDSSLPRNLEITVYVFLDMIVKLAGPVLYSPIFLFPGISISVIGAYLGNIYLKAQMSVKREMSNARSPVLSHFGAAIAGLVSIRAYDAQSSFKIRSHERIDQYTKIARSSYNLNRWISVRSELLGAVFTAALAQYLISKRNTSSANAGFSLNMAFQFCSLIVWFVRYYNEFEVTANSLERIQRYLDIDHEPTPVASGVPPAAWPTSGELRVENLSARYSATGPKVLHDLNFHVKSGERVGIVGRTGSGKSSLTLSLLRCILTEGNVFYDGRPTSQLNLDDLRSKITIIPQMPELLSGSLRNNLDLFEEHDDATLNAALRAAGLFSLQTETDEARLTLDSDISGGGNNLSVGQRQIIALARAMVRRSKLLILDEATSAIDHKTDSIIQGTLRNELPLDTTVLTIAHRLQTIMDADKIIVLDKGRIVEIDSPHALLQKESGYFKSLVDGSGDKKALYAAVKQKNQ